MYGHPTLTKSQRAIYMRGWFAMRKRHRRYIRVILPRLMAAAASAGLVAGAWLHAVIS